MGAKQQINGPDLGLGIPAADLPDGATIAGRVADHPILLSRRGNDFFAVSGACTHYGAHLADGLIAGDEVRCPLHHACFSLRDGRALAAPAFDALTRWIVEVERERVFVRGQLVSDVKLSQTAGTKEHPSRIVIVGGGAAGFAAADMLRRRGFAGDLTMLSADTAAPCDRPNLSKDYLAGTAPEEWIPLKGADFYRDRAIDLRLGVEVSAIDLRNREVAAAGGERVGFDALLLATGSAPIRLAAPGFDLPNVHVLRSFADARAIIASAARARSVGVVGASFIGLEVAASLRARGLKVHVVAPQTVPLERVLGREIGLFVRSVHERQGVRFHLGKTAEGFDGRNLRLNDGRRIAVDFVVLGVGVRPNTALAAGAGLTVKDGVIVDDHLRTSAAGVFAAGDMARYFDPRLEERVRIEHWVAAERQGQIAAANILNERQRFDATPFFWSSHYKHSIRYVGHATRWDALEVDGSIASGDFTARYFLGGRLLAAATLGRDREGLDIHAEMNRRAKLAAAK